MIYLDNSATTRPCSQAVEAMMQAMTQSWGNPSALYNFGIDTARQLKTARHTVAAAMGAEPDRVFFTSGGTEADNWAVFSAGRSGPDYGTGSESSPAAGYHPGVHYDGEQRGGFCDAHQPDGKAVP